MRATCSIASNHDDRRNVQHDLHRSKVTELASCRIQNTAQNPDSRLACMVERLTCIVCCMMYGVTVDEYGAAQEGCSGSDAGNCEEHVALHYGCHAALMWLLM